MLAKSCKSRARIKRRSSRRSLTRTSASSRSKWWIAMKASSKCSVKKSKKWFRWLLRLSERKPRGSYICLSRKYTAALIFRIRSNTLLMKGRILHYRSDLAATSTKIWQTSVSLSRKRWVKSIISKTKSFISYSFKWTLWVTQLIN